MAYNQRLAGSAVAEQCVPEAGSRAIERPAASALPFETYRTFPARSYIVELVCASTHWRAPVGTTMKKVAIERCKFNVGRVGVAEAQNGNDRGGSESKEICSLLSHGRVCSVIFECSPIQYSACRANEHTACVKVFLRSNLFRTFLIVKPSFSSPNSRLCVSSTGIVGRTTPSSCGLRVPTSSS